MSFSILGPELAYPQYSVFKTQYPSPDTPLSKSQIVLSMARNMALSLTGSLALNSSRISRVVAMPAREHPVAIKMRTSLIVCSYFCSPDGTSLPASFPPTKLRALIRASSCVEDMASAAVAFVLSSAFPNSDSPLKCSLASSYCRIMRKCKNVVPRVILPPR